MRGPLLGQDGFRFDLYQERGIDQGAHFDHGGHRKDISEYGTVGATDCLPLGDVRDVDPREDDVGTVAPQGLDGLNHAG